MDQTCIDIPRVVWPIAIIAWWGATFLVGIVLGIAYQRAKSK